MPGSKKPAATDFLLVQDAEIQALVGRFAAEPFTGETVQRLEVLLRAALFKPANALLEVLLQEAVDRLDAGYMQKPGQVRKGRSVLQIQGIFGHMTLRRDYYYHAGKAEGHFPPTPSWVWRALSRNETTREFSKGQILNWDGASLPARSVLLTWRRGR